MKKYLFTAALLLTAMAGAAQETYENAKIVTEDLNGTARYVGMGGAMDALGADISTIGTNPAGVGLFRKSSANVSFGLVSQQDGNDFANGNKTNMSFDQAGFVWAMKSGQNSYFNFAFNYHKSSNFDYILSAVDRLSNASQNKLTYDKAYEDLLFPSSGGVPDHRHPYASCSQLDYMYADGWNYNADDNTWYYEPATAYTLDRAQKGYIGEYDFNLSGNYRDRIYWGVTLGIRDVNYKHYGEYREQLNGFNMLVSDDRKIDGTGFDIKAGVIFRPIEASPFRIGLTVHTPTWYDLTTSNYTTISDGDFSTSSSEAYDFKLYTPWRFGLSLGHTVGNFLALGASYEFADYGSLDTRYNTGDYYDYWYGSYSSSSSSDDVMNRHTEQTLKGVSTLKLGAEYKPIPELALRVGYNYVSPMYNKEGFKDGTLPTDGSYYSSATDYTNWESTNRFTCGLGYNVGQFSLDVAYQYSAQNGKFSPFMNYVNNNEADLNNVANTVDVSNKRHQVLFTLGYKF